MDEADDEADDDMSDMNSEKAAESFPLQFAKLPPDRQRELVDEMAAELIKNHHAGPVSGGLPPDVMSADELQAEASKRSKDIFADWAILHRYLETYEEVMRKRWIKKSNVQRKKIILTAWPEMPQTHNPYFETVVKHLQVRGHHQVRVSCGHVSTSRISSAIKQHYCSC